LCLGPISEPKGFARTAFDYGQHPLSKMAVRAENLKPQGPKEEEEKGAVSGWWAVKIKKL